MNIGAILRFKFPDKRNHERGDYYTSDEGQGDALRMWNDARMGRAAPSAGELAQWDQEAEQEQTRRNARADKAREIHEGQTTGQLQQRIERLEDAMRAMLEGAV